MSGLALSSVVSIGVALLVVGCACAIVLWAERDRL